MKIHFIKNKEYPEPGDEKYKLVYIKDDLWDEEDLGYRKALGYYRGLDTDGTPIFDNCDYGFILGEIVAWADIPMDPNDALSY